MKAPFSARDPRGAERYPEPLSGGTTLIVNEIYESIQGEGPEQGLPVIIVRLTGCNLRCSYCDSAFSFFEGERLGLDRLLERAGGFKARRVLVTGGEPMVQGGTPTLCEALLDKGKKVSLETNGSFSLAGLPPQVVKVVDVKLPDSGCEGSFNTEVLSGIDEKDALKFVCASRKDYEYARSFIAEASGKVSAQIFFMPVWNSLDPAELAGWIIEDGLEARIQVQLHKIIWGDFRGV